MLAHSDEREASPGIDLFDRQFGHLFRVVGEFDHAIADRQIVAGFFSPAATIEVVNWPVCMGNRVMRVPTTHRIAADLGRILHRTRLDLLCATQERLALSLGEFGKVVRFIDSLEQVVRSIREPRDKWVSRNELVESVPVHQQDLASAAFNYDLIGTHNTEQVRYNLGRSIMVAIKPDHFEIV